MSLLPLKGQPESLTFILFERAQPRRASDRAAACAEFYRVLRPGGAAVVSTQHPVMDWLRKGGSYFETTLETDMWRTPSGDQPVHFWREPLSALCTAATDAGFLIEKVIEPVPAETMRERYPEDFERLNREPGFLILRLLKPSIPTRSWLALRGRRSTRGAAVHGGGAVRPRPFGRYDRGGMLAVRPDGSSFSRWLGRPESSR